MLPAVRCSFRWAAVCRQWVITKEERGSVNACRHGLGIGGNSCHGDTLRHRHRSSDRPRRTRPPLPVRDDFSRSRQCLRHPQRQTGCWLLGIEQVAVTSDQPFDPPSFRSSDDRCIRRVCGEGHGCQFLIGHDEGLTGIAPDEILHRQARPGYRRCQLSAPERSR